MTQDNHDVFADEHKFQDDVWEQITLNELERDVIDTPEFQRLFRTSQLGFIDLVYQTANHTRGAHSIGACHVSKMLISRLLENGKAQRGKHPGRIEISPAERVLIRLGALLHDISHVPLSHDLEKKTHRIDGKSPEDVPLKLRSYYGRYPKHDDYDRNPFLYILVFDEQVSVLARVLCHYSKPFYALLREIKPEDLKGRYKHLEGFLSVLDQAEKAGWKPEEKLLPSLLFHLLVYEDPKKDADKPSREIAVRFGKNEDVVKENWGLGPRSKWNEMHSSWYQPFRHDIIGNTLSADLIDYLARDPQRLGTKRRIDLHLLSYYLLVSWQARKEDQPERYRCSIDLYDHKRGTTRVLLINDIFRLLDLRQEIHEKAVMHRVPQAAVAMLARGLLLLGEGKNRRPYLPELVGLGEGQDMKQHALRGEESFFQLLLDRCVDDKANADTQRRLKEAEGIFLRIIDRRVYRPLMIIPGDRAAGHFTFPEDQWQHMKANEYCLRTMAMIIDSPYYSPYLLYVSACIEKFLQGIYDSRLDLCDRMNRVLDTKNPKEFLEQAVSYVPSRVIISTTPYKQLYKDPALVVTLDASVVRIDELTSKVPEENTRLRSVRTLVDHSIQDADSKYAALWALYVFISDGIFYTGILKKLQHCLAGPYDATVAMAEHCLRLKEAQGLLIEAFDVVHDDWSDFCDNNDGSSTRQHRLENPMDADTFKNLARIWIDLCRKNKDANQTDPTRGLSTVSVEHYAHGDPLVDSTGRNCRDIRYKVDKPATDAWIAATKKPDSKEGRLIAFLKRMGLKSEDAKRVSEYEFHQLVERYDQNREHYKGSLVDDPSPTVANLKLLWLSGFPWHEDEGFPKTPDKIKEFIRNVPGLSLLQPNVQRRLIRDELDSIADVLGLASKKHGRAVFDDFRQRIKNEGDLIWNDVREGRIGNALRRKWGLPGAEILPDNPEDN